MLNYIMYLPRCIINERHHLNIIIWIGTPKCTLAMIRKNVFIFTACLVVSWNNGRFKPFKLNPFCLFISLVCDQTTEWRITLSSNLCCDKNNNQQLIGTAALSETLKMRNKSQMTNSSLWALLLDKTAHFSDLHSGSLCCLSIARSIK